MINPKIDDNLEIILMLLIHSRLIDYNTYLPYCDTKILELDNPPNWLLDLAINSNAYNDNNGFYTLYLGDKPLFKNFSFEDLMVSCYYLKYKYNNSFSWKDFLLISGNYTDGFSAKWECEEFYILLNQFEEDSSLLSKQEMLVTYNFQQEISFMEEYYNYFNQFYEKDY